MGEGVSGPHGVSQTNSTPGRKAVGASAPSPAHLPCCFWSHSNLTPSSFSLVSISVIAGCVSPPSCVVSGSSIEMIGRRCTTARYISFVEFFLQK